MLIELEVDADRQEEGDHDRVVGWNLTVMTEEDPEAGEQLWAELAKVEAHLDADCPDDMMEWEASWSQEPMSGMLIATAKKI